MFDIRDRESAFGDSLREIRVSYNTYTYTKNVRRSKNTYHYSYPQRYDLEVGMYVITGFPCGGEYLCRILEEREGDFYGIVLGVQPFSSLKRGDEIKINTGMAVQPYSEFAHTFEEHIRYFVYTLHLEIDADKIPFEDWSVDDLKEYISQKKEEKKKEAWRDILSSTCDACKEKYNVLYGTSVYYENRGLYSPEGKKELCKTIIPNIDTFQAYHRSLKNGVCHILLRTFAIDRELSLEKGLDIDFHRRSNSSYLCSSKIERLSDFDTRKLIKKFKKQEHKKLMAIVVCFPEGIRSLSDFKRMYSNVCTRGYKLERMNCNDTKLFLWKYYCKYRHLYDKDGRRKVELISE